MDSFAAALVTAAAGQSRPTLQNLPLPLPRRLLLGAEGLECTVVVVVVGRGRMLRIQHFLLSSAIRMFTHTWFLSFLSFLWLVSPAPSPRPPLRSFRYPVCPVEGCKRCLLCWCLVCPCDERKSCCCWVLWSGKESDGPFFIFFELCRYASLLVGFLARALLAADNNTDTFRRPEEGYSRLVIYPDTEILVGGRRERRADNGEGV
jgi:hypothetical protein